MGIVIGGHSEPVSPDAHDRQEIAALWPVDLSVLGEEVAALANWADHVGNDSLGPALHHRLNRLVRAVKRRPDEVVHAAVNDNEFLGVGFFDVLDFGKQDAGVADDDPARLKNQRDVETLQPLDDRLGIFFRQRRSFIVVVDAEPAAEVEVANLRPFLL